MSVALEGDELARLNTQDKANTLNIVISLLFDLQASLNIYNKLSEIQSLEIATKIIAGYSFLKLDEVVLVFEQMKKGRYGQFYNKIDSTIIFSCIDTYLASEERALYFERINHNLKVGSNDITQEITVDSKEAQEFFANSKKIFEEKIEQKYKNPIEPNKLFSSSEQYLKKLEVQLSQFTDEELVGYLKSAQRAGYREAIELVKLEMTKRKEK